MSSSNGGSRQESPGSRVPRASRTLQMLALLLILVSGLAGVLAARWMRPNQSQGANQLPDHEVQQLGSKIPSRYFRDWDKPDLVLVLTGSQHGYMLPCGCSRPQFGGLERRYNFVQALRERGWTVAAVDVGDISQRHG